MKNCPPFQYKGDKAMNDLWVVFIFLMINSIIFFYVVFVRSKKHTKFLILTSTHKLSVGILILSLMFKLSTPTSTCFTGFFPLLSFPLFSFLIFFLSPTNQKKATNQKSSKDFAAADKMIVIKICSTTSFCMNFSNCSVCDVCNSW